MRRFLPTARRLFAALAVGVVAGFAVAATISSPANATGREGPEVYTNHGCVTASQAQYQHTFNVNLAAHEATATIEVHGKTLCAGQKQDFALVSYVTSTGKFSLPQYLHDSQVATITHNVVKVEFKIKVPLCYTQVDFVFGKEILPLDTGGNLYGDRKVGSAGAPGSQSSAKRGSQQNAWFNGGRECTSAPAAEGVSGCEGVIAVTVFLNMNATSTTYTIKRGGIDDQTVTVTRAQPQKTINIAKGNGSNVTVWFGATKVGDFAWSQTQKCNAPPDMTPENDCDELRIIVKNPQGNTAITASITTPADASANVAAQVAAAAADSKEIAPGGSHTFHVPGSPNLAVTLLIDGVKAQVFTYLKPAECGGGGGGLPVTGARTGLLVGGGIGLVAVGAGLYLLFRRRRVTFTVS